MATAECVKFLRFTKQSDKGSKRVGQEIKGKQRSGENTDLKNNYTGIPGSLQHNKGEKR